MFQKKNPLDQEWEKLLKNENKFINDRVEKKDSFLNKKLSEKVPEKLQTTLNQAFVKAFQMVFEKGTGVIEKTYKKEELENRFKINQYADELCQSKKSFKAFGKKAQASRGVNLVLSGVSGVGMGVAGIGIPDIPVFTGMILKSIYEIALNYGFEYETEGERRFILMLIQGAVSYGEGIKPIDAAIDDYIANVEVPDDYDEKQQIAQTADSLSKELLYMKFLQGIPVVGAVGGAYDVICLKRITDYANIKYKRRFITKKRRMRNAQ